MSVIQRRQFDVVKDDPSLVGMLLQALRSLENGEVEIAIQGSKVVRIVTTKRGLWQKGTSAMAEDLAGHQI